MTMLKIDRGPSLQYTAPGIILFVIAIPIGFAATWIVGLPFCVAGLCSIFAREAVAFDVENKRFKIETNFFVFKTGNWNSLASYSSVLLDLEIDSAIRQTGSVRGMAAVNTRSRSSHYFVYLVSAAANLLEVHEYQDYNLAKKTADQLSQVLQLPLDNPAGEHLAAAQKRRREKDPRSK